MGSFEDPTSFSQFTLQPFDFIFKKIVWSLFHFVYFHLYMKHHSTTLIPDNCLGAFGSMALIESTAAFRQRCDELVTDGSSKDRLKAASVETFAQMVFALGTPQTAPTTADMDRFAGTIFGPNPTIGQTSTLRMLHFESSTLVVAHFKPQVASDSSEPLTKKLPVAEKQARLAEQTARLTGFLIEDETQPSHALIDIGASIAESNSIQWIAPSR